MHPLTHPLAARSTAESSRTWEKRPLDAIVGRFGDAPGSEWTVVNATPNRVATCTWLQRRVLCHEVPAIIDRSIAASQMTKGSGRGAADENLLPWEHGSCEM